MQEVYELLKGFLMERERL